MAKHSIKNLLRRVSKAGFSKEIVRKAVLPDWWDDEHIDEPDLLPDIEVRVARFLAVPGSVVGDPDAELQAPVYEGAKLRRIRNVEVDRLRPAIHLALGVAAATVRNLKSQELPAEIPNSSATEWRSQLLNSSSSVSLDVMLDDLWSRGIPVVPMLVMPTPSFQALACIIDDRPVVVLGHRLDAPDRVAFVIAHEIGHVTAGDCAPGQPVVDEDEAVMDDANIEIKADEFARTVLGIDHVRLDGAFSDPKDLAREALRIEKDSGVGSGSLIFSWASVSGDYQMATMAVQALYRGSGAQVTLSRLFDANVDAHNAPDTDQALLNCVRHATTPDAVTA